jgi:L-threonylcarbamoyladenylate synthase
MEIINNPTRDEIKKAAKVLKDGHLVAFPTETVYGLGADATNEMAVGRIYSVKGRPIDHPLIVHISSMNQLDKWAVDIPGYAIKLAREFWPGPMTLILKRSSLAKTFITGGQNSVGLRVPAQILTLELLSRFEELGGLGVAAPSANRFGAVSPTTADAVKEELSDFLSTEDLILDGGLSQIGIESTIIDCTKTSPSVLRNGAITTEMIEITCGLNLSTETEEVKVKTSGQLKSHYSPKAKVMLNSNTEEGEGFIAMSNISTPSGAIRLASPKTVEEYARDLYNALRLGDKKNLNSITVMLPQGSGLAAAIRDRLGKSAEGSKNN